MKKFQNTTKVIAPIVLTAVIAAMWQAVCSWYNVKSYILPSPLQVMSALKDDYKLLLSHTVPTASLAVLGVICAAVLAIAVSVLMYRFPVFEAALYPMLIITQTIPTIAVTPLILLWLGYSWGAKLVLVCLTCFFPMVLSLADGFRQTDADMLNLLKSMGADFRQRFVHLVFPCALPSFFSGLKIAVSYSVVTALVSEWLGGTKGLGVYMMRVKKAYSTDKMFACIFIITALTLILIFVSRYIEKKAAPWVED